MDFYCPRVCDVKKHTNSVTVLSMLFSKVAINCCVKVVGTGGKHCKQIVLLRFRLGILKNQVMVDGDVRTNRNGNGVVCLHIQWLT